MVALEDVVEKLFGEDAELKKLLAGDPREAERIAVEKLKAMTDPETNRPRWHTSTIRNRVEGFLRKQEMGPGETKTSAPPEAKTADAAPRAEAEGRDIRKHPDPFADRDEPTADTGMNLDKRIGDAAKRVYDQISEENTAFKNELLGITSDLKSAMVGAFKDLKDEMTSAMKRLPAVEAVPYDDMELRKSTIDSIRKNSTAQKYGEESDYVDDLMKTKEDYDAISKPYNHLVEMTKGRERGVLLKLFYREGKLLFEEQKAELGRLGMKSLLAIGAGAGTAMTVLIIFILQTLFGIFTGTPPVP